MKRIGSGILLFLILICLQNVACSQTQKKGLLLYDAVEESNYQKVRQLLKEGADPNEYKHINHTPLERAVAHDDTAIAKLLLEHGANPNVDSSLGTLAASNNSIAMLDLLVEHGVNLSTGGEYDLSPLEMCLMKNNLEIAKYLLKRGVKSQGGRHSAFELAISNGNIAAVKLFLNSGADPNYVSDLFLSPLMTAVVSLEGLESLIVTAKRINNPIQTYLDQRKNLPIIIELLLHAGASPNGSNRWGSVLYEAASSCDSATVALLLQYGADRTVKYYDPQIPNEPGKTPLDVAKEKGCNAVVKLLE